MIQLFNIQDKVANKISYYLLSAFLIMLPFDFFYSELILICFAVHTLLHCKKERWRMIFSRPVSILILPYFIGTIAMLYGPGRQEAIDLAIRQSPIFIFPILFVLSELDLKKYTLNLLSIFSFTCVAVILFLYIDAIRVILYFHLPFTSVFKTAFINHNFSAPIHLHATYLSMFVALAILFFIFQLLRSAKLNQRILYCFAIAFLCAGLVQLSSRAVVIALLIILNFVLPFFIANKKKRFLFIMLALLLSAASIFLVTQVDAFKVRYIGELKNDLTQIAVNNEILEPRIVRWKLAWELVRRSPLIGYGSGAETGLLKDAYYEHQLYISYLNEFNAHNQYLSFLLRAGIICLLAYLCTLLFGFSLAIKRRDLIFLGFMMMIMITSVSENILNLNKGIFFYSFFLSLFVISDLKDLYKRQPKS